MFLSEGIQKSLYPAAQGAGRFAKIGLPVPELLGPFVVMVEIVGGMPILLGLFTRLAAVPLLMERGFWTMAHEARADWSMTLGLLFLLLVGAGPVSLDRLSRRASPEETPETAGE